MNARIAGIQRFDGFNLAQIDQIAAMDAGEALRVQPGFDSGQGAAQRIGAAGNVQVDVVARGLQPFDVIGGNQEFTTQFAHQAEWLQWPALLAISIELSLRAAGRYLPPGDVPEWALHLDWRMIERIARAIYTWSALLAIFGWSRTLLDRPFTWLPHAREAVFPWYILHQSLIVALAFWLSTLQPGPVWEPLLVAAGTIAGCLVLHAGLIHRSPLLRPLFGLPARRRGSSRDIAGGDLQPSASRKI